MEVSRRVLRDFAKITVKDRTPQKQNSAYGTIVNSDYVQLDGAPEGTLTPIIGVVDAKDGDRVLVTIENHRATVLGNYTFPPSQRDTIHAQGTADEAFGLANKAQQSADAAQEAADDLERIANGALNTAQNAQNEAGKALAKATTAKNKADEALDKANEVDADATSALTKAEQALTDASEAKTSVEEARENASDALGKAVAAQAQSVQAKAEAEEAKGKAEAAQTEVDDVKADVAELETGINNANEAAQNAQTVANEAKQESTVAKEASDKAKEDALAANTAAGEAKTIANSAIKKADAVEPIANEAKAAAASAQESVKAIKDDVDTSLEEIDALSESLETYRQTMEADYARKTELSETTAHFESKFTANAAELEVIHTKIVTVDETVGKAAQDAQDAADEAQRLAGLAQEQATAASSSAASAQTKADQAAAAAAAAQSKADTADEAAKAADAKAAQAAEDLATAKQNLENVTSRVDATEEEIEAAQKAVEDAQAASDQAIVDADNAKKAADEAKTTAASAVQEANNAKTEADNAASAAAAAQTKAEKAESDALAAQQAADEAAEAAAAAQTTANGAVEAAQNAQTAAELAQTAADNADAKLEEAKADLAAAEQNLVNVTSRVDATEEEIEQAKADVVAAQNKANKAESDAATAQTKANEAASAAAAAQTKAEKAISDALAAQTKANNAATVAGEAKTIANTATTNAANAQTKADQAAENAEAAQQVADEAKAKANQAATDLAEAEQNLADVTSRVGATEEEIAEAQRAVINAKAAADQAQSDADTAQSTADTAKSDAAKAQQAADDAQDAADEAWSKANDAATAAKDAQDAANALAIRVTKTETDIKTNSEQIALMATKSEIATTLGGYYTKAQADAAIKVSADNITNSVSSTYQTKAAMSSYPTTTQMNSAIEQKANAITSSVSQTYSPALDYVNNATNNYGYQYVYTITANGDPNLYYPLILRGGDQFVMREILVKRSYSDKAPADWDGHPTAHGIGLTVKIKCNYGGWGGANYSWQIIDLEEMYGNVFAGATHVLSYMGFAIFLRGGGTTGATYTIYSDQPLEVSHATGVSPTIYYNQEEFMYNNDSNYKWNAPAPITYTDTVAKEIEGKRFVYVSSMNTAIEQKANSILSTVSETYVTSAAAGTTYAKKTELSQTSSDLTAKITKAQNTADGAAKTATDFLKFDSSGLLLAKMSDSTLGRNILLNTNDATVDIRDGTTMLATFGPTTRIGKSSGRNVYIDPNVGISIFNNGTMNSRFGDDEIYIGNHSDNVKIYLGKNLANISSKTYSDTSTSVSYTYTSFYTDDVIAIEGRDARLEADGYSGSTVVRDAQIRAATNWPEYSSPNFSAVRLHTWDQSLGSSSLILRANTMTLGVSDTPGTSSLEAYYENSMLQATVRNSASKYQTSAALADDFFLIKPYGYNFTSYAEYYFKSDGIYFGNTADDLMIDKNGTVNYAKELYTPRKIQINLASTSSVNFDGSADVTPGVTGTLPIPNGGTGLTKNPSMLVNLGSTSSANVLAASPRPGVTGTLAIGNGGTGGTTASAARTNLVVWHYDTASAESVNGTYPGLARPNGATTGYVRTPQSGLLPFTSGGSGNVGTSGWPFNYGYFKNLYATTTFKSTGAATFESSISVASTASFADTVYLANGKAIAGYDTNNNARTLLHINSANNTLLGYGGYTANIGRTYIYGKDIWFTTKCGQDIADANAHSYRPYYTKGDSFNIYFHTAGVISSSSTGIFFLIPLSKPVIGCSSVTVTSQTNGGLILRQDGKYTHGSASNTYVNPSSYDSVVVANGIRVAATINATTNAVNNAPVGVQALVTVTFS